MNPSQKLICIPFTYQKCFGNESSYETCFPSLSVNVGSSYFFERYVHSSSKGLDGISKGLATVERWLPKWQVLNPGMVLLKHYISIREQIDIAKTCYSLGEAPGGFCRPGYEDGSKLKFNMTCLGKHWDPQTGKYDNPHPVVDICEAPEIPHGFSLLVQRAIKDAHRLMINNNSDTVDPEDILPSMFPDICDVNLYSMHCRLGPRQDGKESGESLRKGLPVVSMSIGDSAEFLYFDEKDPDQAAKVLLESGDVLLFGGVSRMVFHGVPSIVPYSAPQPLIVKTGLQQAHLSLNFRQI